MEGRRWTLSRKPADNSGEVEHLLELTTTDGKKAPHVVLAGQSRDGPENVFV
jgi:hypothetical protein